MRKRAARRGQWLVVVALLVNSCTSTKPGVVAHDATPITSPAIVADTAVAVDPDVRIVTLANGLTVYLRNNNRPGASAEMRLVINAGSGQEDADQSGTAHFLEHMMFNGTAQFPGNQLVDTLRGFGMEFGADLNAKTNYDETVFELTVPTTKSTNLGTGLDVLREWLSAATLDPAQVDSEKGVVLDEWRQSEQSFRGRAAETSEAMFLAGSGYEGRQTIGSDTAINAMTPELLRRFYDNWYRPDNAAIMVVGDIDVDSTESAIRDRFDTLQPRGKSTARTEPALAAFNTPTAHVLLDPDATTGDVEVTLPRSFTADDSIAGLRHDTLLSLAFDMIATRLTDDISRGLAPYTSATFTNVAPVRWLDAPSVIVSGEPTKLSASMDAVTAEFERARRYGFDAGELDRALRGYRSRLQADFDGSDTVQDADYIDRYVDHFLSAVPIPSADTSFQIYNKIYADVTPEAVDGAFTDLFAGTAPYVLLVAPDSLTDAPTEEGVLARIAALPTIDIAARAATAAAATELMVAPEPVQEISTKSLQGDDDFIAPTMLTFANGARVVLNPTDIADNEIYLSATSPGGLSLVADADLPEALNAVPVVTSSGIGDLDPVALDTVLADASVELHPSIGQTSEDFVGKSTTDDLEKLLQLVNLYLSKPRFDQAALDSTISSLQAYVDDPNSDPDLAGYIAYSAARYGTEPRFRVIPTADELAGIDLPTIERVWRDRFANPGDWVFALSGDFAIDDGRDLARRYIGSLPGTGITEQYKDFQPDLPTAIVTKEVHAGTGDKGTLTFDWNAPIGDPDTESVYADVLASVLNVRLTDHIREKLGASYSPSASVVTNTEPDPLVESYLDVTGDPATLPQISTIVVDDVTELRTTGPTPAEFDAAIAELTDSYSYSDNQTLSDLLARAPDAPELITRFKNQRAVLHDVTPVTLQRFISRVLPLDRYIEVRTLPA